ncbi:MAG: DUF6186 family protein [Acidimicrobiales bacterium]
MTSRGVILAGYAVLAMVAVGIELIARGSGTRATFSDVVAMALRHWPCRILLQAGRLWLGWHVFVRASWS